MNYSQLLLIFDTKFHQLIMRRILLTFFAVCCINNTWAQKALEEIKETPGKCGGVYYAYPTPTSAQTPAPDGYEPFYISHYGRHGSRYMLNDMDYKTPLITLQIADSMGMLTSKGKDVLKNMEEVWKEAEFHSDELAPLGKRQHRGIAERMFKSYPTLFSGNAKISARSTTSMRCALSMVAFCERLKELNPELALDWETSRKNMSYLNYHTKRYDEVKKDPEKWIQDHNKFCARGIDPRRFVSQIISSDEFFEKTKFSKERFFNSMFDVAIDLQDMETEVSFFNLFTPEELYECWRNGNSWFYLCDADSPLNEGTAIESTQPLIQNIVESAELAISGKGDTATLRFGHDGNIIPLAAALHLKGCDAKETDHDIIDEKWQNYNVSPMAANIQLIFFRKQGSDDIIVKFLHNEIETTIPIKTDIAPFYHWKDVKAMLKM